jgi:predicted nucleotidyltransferase component of viral defense system
MSLFDQMLNRYVIKTEDERRNAIHEVMQEITLAGLYRGGFFDKAAFYGGTCLRIFHLMPRFSEDMDFSLVSVNEPFNLEDYFPSVVSEFKASGRLVEITRKAKTGDTKIESAFLKDNPEIYNISFSTEKTVKIKIEVDTNPPMNFTTEQRLLLQPFSFMTRCFTLPDMFAGKMHALLFRNWKTRVKGRDWYDFEWYVRSGVQLNFRHLEERIKQLNGLSVSQEDFYTLLKERLSITDIEKVKRDVEPFLKDRKTLDIWSNDYFLKLAEKIKFLQS